MRMYNAVVP